MQGTRKNRSIIFLAAALITLLAVLYTAFQVRSGLFEDKAYLTPIPQSTIYAFADNVELKTKLQAVIAAQRALNSSRIKFEQPPRVRSVLKTTLSEARKQVQQPGETFDSTQPGSTPVWFVSFKGNLRIEGGPQPANATEVPRPFGPGCAFVIIPTHQQTGTTVGGLGCSE